MWGEVGVGAGLVKGVDLWNSLNQADGVYKYFLSTLALAGGVCWCRWGAKKERFFICSLLEASEKMTTTININILISVSISHTQQPPIIATGVRRRRV